jgi:hypothetical protein
VLPCVPFRKEYFSWSINSSHSSITNFDYCAKYWASVYYGSWIHSVASHAISLGLTSTLCSHVQISQVGEWYFRVIFHLSSSLPHVCYVARSSHHLLSFFTTSFQEHSNFMQFAYNLNQNFAFNAWSNSGTCMKKRGIHAKMRTIPVTGRGIPSVCKTSRLSHSVESLLTDGTCIHNLKLRPPFTSQKPYWYSARFEVFTAVTMKNIVLWDVTAYGFCKHRRFGGTCLLHHQGDKNLPARNVSSSVLCLLVLANVPNSLILVTLMMEAISFSETSVLTRATRRNIPE